MSCTYNSKISAGFSQSVMEGANGDASTVEMLLSQGARVDVRDGGEDTRTLNAAYFGHTQVCELLLDIGKADIEETRTGGGRTSLFLAAAEGNASMVEILLSQGAREDVRDDHCPGLFTPLLVAAQRGHDVCKLLLETGKVDVKKENPAGFTASLLLKE